MERFRLLAAFFMGTFFYTILSFIGGEDGLWAMNQLRLQKQILSAHTASIEKIHDELSTEALTMEKDLDVISSYAKRLGYVGENEKIVKIKGLPVQESYTFDPGTMIKHVEVKFIPESICKACALCIIVLSYCVLILLDIKNGYISFSIKSRAYSSKTSVYDLPKNT